MPEILIGVVIFALLIIVVVAANKKNKEATAKGITSFSPGVVLHGIPHVPPKTEVEVSVLSDKITFKTKDLTFDLALEQVKAAAALKTTDILTKDKSVIGRGIIGGVLLGPLGAIIGGMSGIGKKQLKGAFLVINYLPKNSDEIEVIIVNLYLLLNAKHIADDITKKLINQKAVSGTIEL